MTGLVIITHGELGRHLLQVAEFIVGPMEGVRAVGVEDPNEGERITRELKHAVEEVDEGQGVVIFTDMFGGTPNNLSLPLMDGRRVEVVTGVNLPMLIAAANARKDHEAHELARIVCQAGKDSISVAGQLLYEE